MKVFSVPMRSLRGTTVDIERHERGIRTAGSGMGGARVADIRFHVRAALCRRLERIPDGTLLALGIDLAAASR
jgi:hypothetical protein